MTQSYGQTWEEVNEAALAAIGSVARETMDLIMARVGKHLDAPLRMGQTQPTANTLLNFQPNQVEVGDGKSRTTPPIEDVITPYVGATIDLQALNLTGGTVLRDNVAFTLPGGYTPTDFVLAVFVYNGPGNAINCTFSTGQGSIGALPNPGSLFSALDGVPIGYVYLQATGASSFKTAGSATNIIENKVGANPRIFVFGGGTGSGSGGGDTSFTAKTLQSDVLTLKKGFLMLDYQVELVTYNGVTDNSDILVNLKTEVRTDGVTSPAASTAYYLYVDLFSLGAEVSYGTTDRKVYRVQKGTSGGLVVLATKPAATNPRRYVALASLKTDGSSNYTAFADFAHRRHDSVAAFVTPPQTKTYQLTTAVASNITAHGMGGEPQVVNLYYYDGTKKIGLDSSSHLLNKDTVNVELSSLGLTFGGGKYLEAQIVFYPALPDSFVTIRHNYTSPWMTTTAVTTLLHSLGSNGIGGYEVQEWDVILNKIRNIDRSALVINFDKDNFYLDWTGLTPTGTLQYRVVSGATPIPSLTPITRAFEVTASFTARVWDEILIKSAAPLTMTLPASPVLGDRVVFYDGLDNWGVYNVTVNRNGSLIDGVATNATLSISGSTAEFIYSGSVQGWIKVVAAAGNTVGVSPKVYSLSQAVGSVGSASQIKAGHVLTAESFPASGSNLSWWKLDNNLNDGSGNAVTLLTTGTWAYGLGIFGEANGAGSSGAAVGNARLTNNAFITMANTAQRSIGAWFYPTTIPGSYAGLLGLNSSGEVFSLDYSSIGMRLRISTVTPGAADVIIVIPVVLAVNTWQHISVTFQPGIFSVYVDGKVVSTTSVATMATITGTNSFYIGTTDPSSTQLYGRVAHVFVNNSVAYKDSDIRKIMSTKISHSSGLASANQDWKFLLGSGVQKVPSISPVVDQTSPTNLYADFSDLSPTETVDVALLDLSLYVIPSEIPFDVTYVTSPSFPISHGLSGVPLLQVAYLVGGVWSWSTGEGSITATASAIQGSLQTFFDAGATNVRLRATLGDGPAGIRQATATTLGLVKGGTVPGQSSATAIAAGNIGEILTSQVAVQPVPASATRADVTTLTLTAGVWDVVGSVVWEKNSATQSVYLFVLSIITAAGNASTNEVNGINTYYSDGTASTSTIQTFITPLVRVVSDGTNLTIVGTTTVGQVVRLKLYPGTYSVATPFVSGILRATRVA